MAGTLRLPTIGFTRSIQRMTSDKNFGQWFYGYLFIIPTFVFLLYFLYYPAFTALIGGFTQWDGFNTPEFVGLDNFMRAFEDPTLRASVGNNLLWMVLGTIIAIVPAFIVAEMIFFVRNRTMQYIFRTLFIFNMIIPQIVTILIWTYFYRSDGVINQLLGGLGLENWQRLWLADPKIALYSLILMGFPWINAINMLILYSGLQGISSEIFEASTLDGVTGISRVFRIDIPLIMPQVKLLIILAVVHSVQNILAPLIMTGGGPGTSTFVPVLRMYQVGVNYGQYGYSMAISFILFLVVLVLTIINMRFIRAESY